MSAGFHFLADPRRPDDPAYEDAGEKGDEGHEKAVADIVHQIQKLGSSAVWQLQFKIKYIVAHTDDHRGCRREKGDHKAGFLSGGVENFHTVCHQCFQNGYRGSKGSKHNHKEKYHSQDSAQRSHGLKDFGQGYEHQTGAGGHSLGAEEYLNGGDDHKSGQKCNRCIKNLDLA